jgi:hypothetical protein
MSATRLPLLGAFAGGCLSAAVLFVVWQASSDDVPAPKERARSVELVAPAVAARIAEPPPPVREVVKLDSPAPAASDRVSAELEPAPTGSAVSDILTDLEAAYRQRLIAAARAEAAAANEPTPARASTTAAPAEPREIVTRAAAPVSPAVVPAAVAPTVVAPAAVALVAPSEPAAVAPAPVAQVDSRPPAVHFGDINQNTYVTNVRQGDVYVIQQQIAMMQYMQLLGASAGLAQPANFPRGGLPQAAQRPPFRQFPSTLTNPDNPWGFNLAPPNLVH